MKTTKRFTPTLIRNWKKKGRGTGRLSEYSPWHQVTRGDPASLGRSHIVNWAKTDRMLHFLSDGELTAFYFATMLPNLFDLREQFPLSKKEALHELSQYSIQYMTGIHPGTADIANKSSIGHPSLREKGEIELWTMTTDLLITLKEGSDWTLLGVSVKPDANALSKRNKELLNIEKFYWEARETPWLLITPNQYDKRVAKCLQRSAGWVVSEKQFDQAVIKQCIQIVEDLEGASLTEVLIKISNELSVELMDAQRIFWQAIWKGELPVDLRRGWRPEEPVCLISHEEFKDLNPIASGRTACFF